MNEQLAMDFMLFKELSVPTTLITPTTWMKKHWLDVVT